jgi:hypothetical protein
MKSRRRPVVAAGATASLFETAPVVIDLEKYARQSLASRRLRRPHSLAQDAEQCVMISQSGNRALESREVRRPSMDRKWSPVIAERVIEVVARTGSPKVASKATGVSVATIHDHRKRDPDFGARYAEAMECAFNVVLGHAFERSLDTEAPSDRLTEVLLKFRFVDRAPAFDPTAPDRSNADGPLGLDARVIARMAPQDRAALAAALGTYIQCETELHADDALIVLP